jgi:signal transduction histidine kinase
MVPMRTSPTPWLQRRHALWAGVLLMLGGAALIVRVDIAARRAVLQAEARTAHRLLSQATSRLDAVLATLALMARPNDGGAAGDMTRLPALYPQVVSAWRRDAAGAWPPELADALAAAEQRSLTEPAAARHATLAAIDAARAQYTLVLAGSPASFALRIDARRLVREDDWPWPADAPVQVTLTHGDRVIVLHDPAGAPARPFGLTDGFEMTKALDSASQPFVLHAQRFTGPAQWPWLALASWAASCGVLAWVLQRWLRARAAQRQAAEQTRLVLASRLNTMGELAAGIAHELNQPLTAVLAGTQTALRLLRERATHEAAEDADAATASEALELAAAQARRASEVVARLRRLVQPGAAAGPAVPTDLGAVARRLVHLMTPEFDAADIAVSIEGEAPAARADPVAVEQILHNLLGNAVQALRQRGGAGRITITLAATGDRVRCTVRDDGPGVAPQALPRLFEPFFTTRAGGLGLGLPLCQTLATAMDGQVVLRESSPAGAAFELELPATAGAGHPS